MSFSEELKKHPDYTSPLLRQFHSLLAPCDDAQLESLAQEAVRVTRRNFGQTMRLFAPLYLSNECINTCKYCGFSRDNPILRVTLDGLQLSKECQYLGDQGFRNVLLVAGEHPKFISSSYLEFCVEKAASIIPAVSIEVAPLKISEYVPLIQAGAEGVIVYQETYHPETYADLHVQGPKKNFDWRVDTPERAHEAGFRRIGIGALFGLYEWRYEAMALARHLEFLQRVAWKSQLTVSFPRMRPAAGEFTPKYSLPDREFVQLIIATRLCFPNVGIVLSTRETPALRNALAPLGITMMSAGSHTEPGGYTHQGHEDLHLTVKGKHQEPESLQPGALAEEQFEIADTRSPEEIAQFLLSIGLDPIWKDWDTAILQAKAS